MALFMSRLKSKQIKVRKLLPRGGGVGITLPIEYIRRLGWKKKQKVVVELKGKSIKIKDWE